MKRLVWSLLAAIWAMPASALATRSVTLDVVLFNYLPRPIFEVFIDGEAGDSSTPYPATGGSTIAGVRLKLGVKRVTWRLGGPTGMPRNGELVVARNAVELTAVPKDARYLGVHVYPDETVELIPTQHYPRRTEKGMAMAEAAKPGRDRTAPSRQQAGGSG